MLKASRREINNGIILRNSCKSNLMKTPPIMGEIVYATDTGEHGWLDHTGKLLWVVLGTNSPEEKNIIFKGDLDPSDSLGENGDKYLQKPKTTKLSEFEQTIVFGYSAESGGNSFINSSNAYLYPNVGVSRGDDVITYLSTRLQNSIINNKKYIDFNFRMSLKNFINPELLNFVLAGVEIEMPRGAFDKTTGVYEISFKGFEENFLGVGDFDQIYKIVENINENPIQNVYRVEVDTFPYTEWIKTEDKWQKQILYRVLFEAPKTENFLDDPEGTLYYILEK